MTPTAKKISSRRNLEALEIREGLEGLSPARIATLYRRAPLLRPVDDPHRLWSMFEASSVVFTAWDSGQLVGIARVLSDGVLFSYLCDLAVEPDVQGRGVGKALVQRVLDACKGTELLLRDSDISSTYYAHLSFERVENAWMRRSR